jgi:S1-C subfamily serine protease
MKFLVSLVAFLLTITAPHPALGQALKSPSEIAREQSQAVVVIEQLDERGNTLGQGSGFIVTSSGAILTNLHVIQGATVVRVKLPNGDVYKTSDVVDVDEAKDIAIIKIKGFQLPVVRLGDSDRTEVGEPIVAISSPEGLTNSLSTGVISGVRRFDTHRVFQITAPISQGSSGGALFDSTGAVIGITSFVLKAGQNINFALPINYARGMISEQVTTTLSKLPAAPSATEKVATSPAEADEGSEMMLDGRVSHAARTRLGRAPDAPMFARPDEAMTFFYRLVEGIGRDRLPQIAELTRTAAAIKTKDTPSFDEYTIKYLSFYSGLTLGFSKPERVLTSVELIVNWSLADLERTFGDSYKKKTAGSTRYLEFKDKESGHQIIATLDDNGVVRSVRYSKAK